MRKQQIKNVGTVCQIPYVTRDKRVNKALDYISTNYTSYLLLDDAAEEAGISRSYLCILFREEVAISFAHYCAAFRLNKAAYLLEHTEESIADVAKACGFTSSSYFIKTFRRATEKTPREYREALRKVRGKRISRR